VWGKFVFPLCGKEKQKGSQAISSSHLVPSFFLSFPFHAQFRVTRAWMD